MLEPNERGVGVGGEREGRAITGNTCERTLPIRVVDVTSRSRDANARGGCANPSPARSSSVASRSWPGVG